jgi:hypothetical protein
LVGDIITEVFLERNADFQQHFAYQQDGLLRRTLASGLEGEWVAITFWRSMTDARRSAAEASTSPIAIAFQSLLESGSIDTEYFKELPG